MGPLTPHRDPSPHQRYRIRTELDVGVVRRAAGRMAAAVGARPDVVRLAVAELASNILRHASGDGYLLLWPGAGCMELIAADHGPGLGPDAILPAAVRHPRPLIPGRGLGIGLAAVRRLATQFDCFSTPDGAVILARFGDPPRSWPGLARWGAINLPLGDTGDSGDGWLVKTHDSGHLTAMVVDGLGHGAVASWAASAATSSVAERAVTDPGLALVRAHEAMRGTRGGVLGIAVIDAAASDLAWAGAGNIVGWILHNGKRVGLLSFQGAVGIQAQPPRPRVVHFSWPPGATLILASDGIHTLHHLESYAGLWTHDPSVAAAVLHRDCERTTDDACVLVIQDTRLRR
ncbi:SpoIIE family protein phosphatase [Streptomyces sp. NPDC059680]|uniref:SpoIIE family protein phosphatase n=1 Tax=Streptomyces sp. NPDC059680 TaxID=3346904 RepID=UPI00368664A5